MTIPKDNVFKMNGLPSQSAFKNTNEIYDIIDSLPYNIMYCGTDLVIKYLSPQSMATLKKLESNLPVPVDQIVGSKIDVFHKDPAQLQRLLANPQSLPLRKNIKIGSELIDVFIYPISDQGNYSGAMVCWNMVTENEKMKSTVHRLSEEIAHMTKDISEKSNSFVKGSQSLGTTTKEISSAVNVLTNSINSIIEHSRSAGGIAQQTTQEAEVGSKAINKAIEAMDLISKSSQEISDIVKVISEIASQTSLLAFNAAIEAARAGEHGSGFSVVAEEVRKLAVRSSQATKEISKLINESVKRIAQGSEISKQAGDAFGKIVSGVEQTTKSISEISAATEGQLSTAKEVSLAVQKVAEQTEKSTTVSESLTNATTVLAKGAEELKGLLK